MNELALFAGAGGGILGGKLLGWRTVCAVEIEPYAASVLIQRQNDGILQPFPVWDDIATFNGKPWQGIVDVVSGGFPCQDISVAGKGAGIEGKRSGLWREMRRIIEEVSPRYAFIENSPNLTRRGLEKVLFDLASLGYDAKWGCISGISIGASQKRNRLLVVANSEDNRPLRRQWGGTENKQARCGRDDLRGNAPKYASGEWWNPEPKMGRVAHGVPNRLDRIKALGNGQIPAVAALAWELLKP